QLTRTEVYGPFAEVWIRDVDAEPHLAITFGGHSALMDEARIFAGRPLLIFLVIQIAVVIQVGFGVESRDDAGSLAVRLHIVPAQDRSGHGRNAGCGRTKTNIVESQRAANRHGFPVRRWIEV